MWENLVFFFCLFFPADYLIRLAGQKEVCGKLRPALCNFLIVISQFHILNYKYWMIFKLNSFWLITNLKHIFDMVTKNFDKTITRTFLVYDEESSILSSIILLTHFFFHTEFKSKDNTLQKLYLTLISCGTPKRKTKPITEKRETNIILIGNFHSHKAF